MYSVHCCTLLYTVLVLCRRVARAIFHTLQNMYRLCCQQWSRMTVLLVRTSRYLTPLGLARITPSQRPSQRPSHQEAPILLVGHTSARPTNSPNHAAAKLLIGHTMQQQSYYWPHLAARKLLMGHTKAISRILIACWVGDVSEKQGMMCISLAAWLYLWYTWYCNAIMITCVVRSSY